MPDRQLADRLAAHRLADRAQGGRELVDRVIARHVLRLEVDLGHAAVVAGGQAVEDLRQPLPRAAVDPAHDAEVDRHDRAVGAHEQVPLVHVGVEEPAADRLGEERQHQPAGELRQVVPGGLERGDVADLDAVDPLDRQHPAVGAVPVDRGDAVALEALHRLGQLGGRGGLAAQVELAAWSSA